jgi:hypothetical protein
MSGYEENEGGGRAGRVHHCSCCAGAGGHDGRARGAGAGEEGPNGRGGRGGARGAQGGGGQGFFGGAAGTGKAIGAGALIAAGVMLLTANRQKLKPAVKGTLKEYYRFSDWLGANFAQVKEELSDMAAEARHDYEQEMATHVELLEKERQLVQRLANMAKKRSEEG